uniref:Uncharacterized protein n=1 Tax=Arundo donax TaxID=35708 RepID=A0A0A9F5F4_ARUDO
MVIGKLFNRLDSSHSVSRCLHSSSFRAFLVEHLFASELRTAVPYFVYGLYICL